MTAVRHDVQRVTRRDMQRWLPQLDAWLLPDALYGVMHTWPQLYRSDGDGAFFVIVDGDRLLSHCAVRTVTLCDELGERPVGLLGSVATDPKLRGQGLASQVLERAVAEFEHSTAALLLWAERPELYERLGFAFTSEDTCLWLARRPRREPAAGTVVRAATVHDHVRLCELHAKKPRRVERSASVMSGLLTTPGLTTLVLERHSEVVAYACAGKGADLQGHWHELGGDDEDLAELLPAAMHIAGQTEAALLLPPYRQHLAERIQDHVVGRAQVPGPMERRHGALPCGGWFDGLDSV